MRGVLLIALGHRYYFEMAKNLAASIRVNDPDMQICIATDREVIIEHQKLFDRVVRPSDNMFIANGKLEFIKSKLFMYDLSPFHETIFLDVDQIVLQGRKLSDLFEELKDTDFTMSNTGAADFSIWANVKEVQQLYGDRPFWNFHSELVYFRKSKTARVFFDTAKKIYRQAKIRSATRFAEATMADELAFQVAAISTGIYPHKEHWTPNFWFRRHRAIAGAYPYQLKHEYYTYSIGGSFLPSFIQANYNNLATYYFNRLGLQNPYKARHKSDFLPERNKI